MSFHADGGYTRHSPDGDTSGCWCDAEPAPAPAPAPDRTSTLSPPPDTPRATRHVLGHSESRSGTGPCSWLRARLSRAAGVYRSLFLHPPQMSTRTVLPGCTKPCRTHGGNKKMCLLPPTIIMCNPKIQYKLLRHIRWMQEQTSLFLSAPLSRGEGCLTAARGAGRRFVQHVGTGHKGPLGSFLRLSVRGRAPLRTTLEIASSCPP